MQFSGILSLCTPLLLGTMLSKSCVGFQNSVVSSLWVLSFFFTLWKLPLGGESSLCRDKHLPPSQESQFHAACFLMSENICFLQVFLFFVCDRRVISSILTSQLKRKVGFFLTRKNVGFQWDINASRKKYNKQVVFDKVQEDRVTRTSDLLAKARG